jgi:hypothetical protein
MSEKISILTLGDLGLGLNDLFTNRLLSFQKSKICQTYEEQLKTRLEKLNAAPSVFKGGAPLAEQLEQGDVRHDGYLDTILLHTEGALTDPDAPPEQKAASKKILDTIRFKASDKGADYAKEAITAKEREDKIKGLKVEFSLFPLSGGRTLYDTALSYIESGKKLDELLAERSRLDAMNTTDRSDIRSLRHELLGRINRCRAALQDEISENPALARNLDAEIFGYFDELHKTREAQAQNRAEVRAKEEEEAKTKEASEARRKAAEAQHQAEESARLTEEAQRKAKAAREEADKKSTS